MNHIEDVRLIEFLNGELDIEDSKIVQEHVSLCEKCSIESEKLSKVINALSFDQEPSQEFKNALLMNIKEEIATEIKLDNLPRKSWFYNSHMTGRVILAIGSIAAVVALAFIARATLSINETEIPKPTAFAPVSINNAVDISINEAYSDEFQEYLNIQLEDVGGRIIAEFTSTENSLSVEIPYSVISYFTRKIEVAYNSIIENNSPDGSDEVQINFTFTE